MWSIDLNTKEYRLNETKHKETKGKSNLVHVIGRVRVC